MKKAISNMTYANMISEVEDQYDVSLTTEDYTYCVKYGSEVIFTEFIDDALEFYNNCVKHQLECSGLLDLGD